MSARFGCFASSYRAGGASDTDAEPPPIFVIIPGFPVASSVSGIRCLYTRALGVGSVRRRCLPFFRFGHRRGAPRHQPLRSRTLPPAKVHPAIASRLQWDAFVRRGAECGSVGHSMPIAQHSPDSSEGIRLPDEIWAALLEIGIRARHQGGIALAGLRPHVYDKTRFSRRNVKRLSTP